MVNKIFAFSNIHVGTSVDNFAMRIMLILMNNRIPKFKMNTKFFYLILLFSLSILLMSVSKLNAQVQLQTTGSVNVDSINTGSQFTYTMNYQISSLTHNGINVIAKMGLPPNVIPTDTTTFSNSLSGVSNAHINSVTYNSSTDTITVTFKPQ